MDIKRLFAMQYDLNKRIVSEHDLEKEGLFEKRRLAFLVELGELANETRCFKYWSKRSPSSKDVILEEYVDGLHFVLSIGLDLGFADIDLIDEVELLGKVDKIDMTALFLSLYRWGSNAQFSKEDFHTFFEEFLSLGVRLGFRYSEMESAYLQKNQVNHERQNSGY